MNLPAFTPGEFVLGLLHCGLFMLLCIIFPVQLSAKLRRRHALRAPVPLPHLRLPLPAPRGRPRAPLPALRRAQLSPHRRRGIRLSFPAEQRARQPQRPRHISQTQK